MSQQIIGLERVLQTSGGSQTWNNKKIRWSIVHNINSQTKPYDIELQMVLVSSKRIVRVNGQTKDTQMCSFGYESKFDISQKLKGHIKQDSLTFQLFVNGQSFTKLQQSNKAYEPPKLDQALNNPWSTNEDRIKENKKNQNPFFQIKQKSQKKPQKSQNVQNLIKLTKTTSATQQPNSLAKSMQYKPQPVKYEIPQLKHKPISDIKQDKKVTQNVLKDTQNQLIRILMQEKRRKKQEQKAKEMQS